MATEDDFTLGGEHPMQYTDDELQKCMLETYIILLTSITPINLIKIKKECENTFVKKKVNQFPLPIKRAPQKQPFF